MAEKAAKSESTGNSANLIARNKDSPFQILDVRSLTSSIDDEVGVLDIEAVKSPDKIEETDPVETEVEKEDGAEEDTTAEKDETVPDPIVQHATTTDQDPREEATATEDETAVVQNDARAPDAAAVEDNSTIEEDVGTVGENTAKTKEQHQKSAKISENAYSTDEEPDLVIDMSFEEEESPRKRDQTTVKKHAVESVTEQTDKKAFEHSDPISNGSAEPITLSNGSNDDEEEATRKEAIVKVNPKAEQVSEDEAGVEDEEGDDDVEFVEETNELRDVEGLPIKEEEDEMDQMEITSGMCTLINIIAGLRVATNVLLGRHHTLQINFDNTVVDTKNYEDCSKWVQTYLRSGR
uniref:Uncharacterized protein n=1 Tax=Anopheles albimanus TaxID=7167 RepID=A0A182F0P9_ANOAL